MQIKKQGVREVNLKGFSKGDRCTIYMKKTAFDKKMLRVWVPVKRAKC